MDSNFPIQLQLRGSTLQLLLVPDHDPQMVAAFKLWNDVFAAELRYVSLANEWERDWWERVPPRGALVMMAMHGDDCVATLRMTYGQKSQLDFDYSHLLPGVRLGELTKLVARRDWRRSAVIPHMLLACHRFNAVSGNEALYDQVVITCFPRIMHYYTLFGFVPISGPVKYDEYPEEVVHMACTKASNRKAVKALEVWLRGGLFGRWRWGLRYLQARWVTQATRRV
jgi:hypothetical protein